MYPEGYGVVPIQRKVEIYSMSFDALTILGISSSVLCGGFLIALIKRNDSGNPHAEQKDRFGS